MRQVHGFLSIFSFVEGIVGSTNKIETIKTWAYSYNDCLTLTNGLEEMREEDITNVQLTHKEEEKSLMKNYGFDRNALREKLAICIDPLSPSEHPTGLINIWLSTTA